MSKVVSWQVLLSYQTEPQKDTVSYSRLSLDLFFWFFELLVLVLGWFYKFHHKLLFLILQLIVHMHMIFYLFFHLKHDLTVKRCKLFSQICYTV